MIIVLVYVASVTVGDVVVALTATVAHFVAVVVVAVVVDVDLHVDRVTRSSRITPGSPHDKSFEVAWLPALIDSNDQCHDHDEGAET